MKILLVQPAKPEAIEIDPKLADAYCNRGGVYMEKGRYDRAIADQTKAIEIDPKFALAYYNRGISYYFEKKYDKCWQDFKKAQNLGYQIPPKVLERLRKASGRQN